MNTRLTRFVPVLLALAAGAAFAQEATPDHFDHAAATRSRAEVRAETLAAIRNHEIEHGEASSYTLALQPVASTLTRAQVRAEAAEALRLGLAPRGEYSERVATAQELEQIRQAGLRALERVAQKR